MVKKSTRDACPWASVLQRMKDAGAEMIGKDAVAETKKIIEENAEVLIGRAIDISRHARRKKLTGKDIDLSIYYEKNFPTTQRVEGESPCTHAGTERIIKSLGAQIVASDAILKVQQFLDRKITDLTKHAVKIAEDDKRKKIVDDDIRGAEKIRW